MMKLNKKELLDLIQEEVKRQQKKLIIDKKIQALQEQISKIENNSPLLKEILAEDAGLTNVSANLNDTGAQQPGADFKTSQPSTFYDEPKAGKAEKTFSLYTLRQGQFAILNFQGDTTIKLEKKHNPDIFQVVGADSSAQVKEGDNLRLLGNGLLKTGGTYKFDFTNAAKTYQTPALQSWEHVK
jgi:hypothetical protein